MSIFYVMALAESASNPHKAYIRERNDYRHVRLRADKNWTFSPARGWHYGEWASMSITDVCRADYAWRQAFRKMKEAARNSLEELK